MQRVLVVVLALLLGCARAPATAAEPLAPASSTTWPDAPRSLSEADWAARLSPMQDKVLRHQGTERPFTSAFLHNHQHGAYRCAGCGQLVFVSEDKFDSGTGWPSFTRPASASAVEERVDRSLGMARTEILCARCGGHLGHVFNDGPAPTLQRWCINGVALVFEPSEPGQLGELAPEQAG